jgi:hypothetical protein
MFCSNPGWHAWICLLSPRPLPARHAIVFKYASTTSFQSISKSLFYVHSQDYSQRSYTFRKVKLFVVTAIRTLESRTQRQNTFPGTLQYREQHESSTSRETFFGIVEIQQDASRPEPRLLSSSTEPRYWEQWAASGSLTAGQSRHDKHASRRGPFFHNAMFAARNGLP